MPLKLHADGPLGGVANTNEDGHAVHVELVWSLHEVGSHRILQNVAVLKNMKKGKIINTKQFILKIIIKNLLCFVFIACFF